MTPETEALIARVRELYSKPLTTTPIYELADLAPQLATALEAESKRADAAETHARRSLDQLEKSNEALFSTQMELRIARSRAETAEDHLTAAEAKLKESSEFFEDAIGEQIIQAKMWKGHYAGDPEGQKDEAFWDGQERAFEMCLNLVKSALTQLEP